VPEWIGYRWLIERYGLTVTQALPAETAVGRTRATHNDGYTQRRTVQEALRPENTVAAHLAFALKHEGVHLETLSRLFAVLPASELENWIRSEPRGQYTGRAGFLYERLSGRQLDVADRRTGNYVPVLDPERELTAVKMINNARWRVRDNLLGDSRFSPQVYLTSATHAALALDVGQRIARLEGQFSRELVMRSAVWLTVKESRASFAIEHEENKLDRIQRFATVLEQRTGRSANPLDPYELEALQREILGPNALHYGLRQSPIFVGQSDRLGRELVHYIAPPFEAVSSILAGLQVLLKRTQGLSSVARAALVSFGLVYLHPMIDGNGRISRFLINDILRRDGALPAPYIVPISAVLQRPNLRPLTYDDALELFSRPLMQQYRDRWSFGPEQQAADGVRYNLQFAAYPDALHAWRYPDLTRHVAFIADALDVTIEQEMRDEAQYLQQHGAARDRLKTIIEGPDPALDRIIRSVRESRGTISGKLRREHPLLERPEIADEIVRAIREEFPWTPAGDLTTKAPEQST
jgi:Fic/DOC family